MLDQWLKEKIAHLESLSPKQFMILLAKESVTLLIVLIIWQNKQVQKIMLSGYSSYNTNGFMYINYDPVLNDTHIMYIFDEHEGSCYIYLFKANALKAYSTPFSNSVINQSLKREIDKADLIKSCWLN